MESKKNFFRDSDDELEWVYGENLEKIVNFEYYELFESMYLLESEIEVDLNRLENVKKLSYTTSIEKEETTEVEKNSLESSKNGFIEKIANISKIVGKKLSVLLIIYTWFETKLIRISRQREFDFEQIVVLLSMIGVRNMAKSKIIKADCQRSLLFSQQIIHNMKMKLCYSDRANFYVFQNLICIISNKTKEKVKFLCPKRKKSQNILEYSSKIFCILIRTFKFITSYLWKANYHQVILPNLNQFCESLSEKNLVDVIAVASIYDCQNYYFCSNLEKFTTEIDNLAKVCIHYCNSTGTSEIISFLCIFVNLSLCTFSERLCKAVKPVNPRIKHKIDELFFYVIAMFYNRQLSQEWKHFFDSLTFTQWINCENSQILYDRVVSLKANCENLKMTGEQYLLCCHSMSDILGKMIEIFYQSSDSRVISLFNMMIDLFHQTSNAEYVLEKLSHIIQKYPEILLAYISNGAKPYVIELLERVDLSPILLDSQLYVTMYYSLFNSIQDKSVNEFLEKLITILNQVAERSNDKQYFGINSVIAFLCIRRMSHKSYSQSRALEHLLASVNFIHYKTLVSSSSPLRKSHKKSFLLHFNDQEDISGIIFQLLHGSYPLNISDAIFYSLESSDSIVKSPFMLYFYFMHRHCLQEEPSFLIWDLAKELSQVDTRFFVRILHSLLISGEFSITEDHANYKKIISFLKKNKVSLSDVKGILSEAAHDWKLLIMSIQISNIFGLDFQKDLVATAFDRLLETAEEPFMKHNWFRIVRVICEGMLMNLMSSCQILVFNDLEFSKCRNLSLLYFCALIQFEKWTGITNVVNNFVNDPNFGVETFLKKMNESVAVSNPKFPDLFCNQWIQFALINSNDPFYERFWRLKAWNECAIYMGQICHSSIALMKVLENMEIINFSDHFDVQQLFEDSRFLIQETGRFEKIRKIEKTFLNKKNREIIEEFVVLEVEEFILSNLYTTQSDKYLSEIKKFIKLTRNDEASADLTHCPPFQSLDSEKQELEDLTEYVSSFFQTVFVSHKPPIHILTDCLDLLSFLIENSKNCDWMNSLPENTVSDILVEILTIFEFRFNDQIRSLFECILNKIVINKELVEIISNDLMCEILPDYYLTVLRKLGECENLEMQKQFIEMKIPLFDDFIAKLISKKSYIGTIVRNKDEFKIVYHGVLLLSFYREKFFQDEVINYMLDSKITSSVQYLAFKLPADDILSSIECVIQSIILCKKNYAKNTFFSVIKIIFSLIRNNTNKTFSQIQWKYILKVYSDVNGLICDDVKFMKLLLFKDASKHHSFIIRDLFKNVFRQFSNSFDMVSNSPLECFEIIFQILQYSIMPGPKFMKYFVDVDYDDCFDRYWQTFLDFSKLLLSYFSQLGHDKFIEFARLLKDFSLSFCFTILRYKNVGNFSKYIMKLLSYDKERLCSLTLNDLFLIRKNAFVANQLKVYSFLFKKLGFDDCLSVDFDQTVIFLCEFYHESWKYQNPTKYNLIEIIHELLTTNSKPLQLFTVKRMLNFFQIAIDGGHNPQKVSQFLGYESLIYSAIALVPLQQHFGTLYQEFLFHTIQFYQICCSDNPRRNPTSDVGKSQLWMTFFFYLREVYLLKGSDVGKALLKCVLRHLEWLEYSNKNMYMLDALFNREDRKKLQSDSLFYFDLWNILMNTNYILTANGIPWISLCLQTCYTYFLMEHSFENSEVIIDLLPIQDYNYFLKDEELTTLFLAYPYNVACYLMHLLYLLLSPKMSHLKRERKTLKSALPLMKDNLMDVFCTHFEKIPSANYLQFYIMTYQMFMFLLILQKIGIANIAQITEIFLKTVNEQMEDVSSEKEPSMYYCGFFVMFHAISMKWKLTGKSSSKSQIHYERFVSASEKFDFSSLAKKFIHDIHLEILQVDVISLILLKMLVPVPIIKQNADFYTQADNFLQEDSQEV